MYEIIILYLIKLLKFDKLNHGCRECVKNTVGKWDWSAKIGRVKEWEGR